MPEQVLGAEEVRKLAKVEMSGWYPIEWLLDLMEKVDKELGHYGLLQMGRKLFALSHEERLVQVARSAADVIYGIDGMYHHANRGTGIGGWKVLRFDPGYAELEKTTPHHCVMEQGILSGALAAVKCPGIVSQKQCFRQGADACIYVISSSFTDERWFGSRAAPSADATAAAGKPSQTMEAATRAASGSTKTAEPGRGGSAGADSANRLRNPAEESSQRSEALTLGLMAEEPIERGAHRLLGRRPHRAVGCVGNDHERRGNAGLGDHARALLHEILPVPFPRHHHDGAHSIEAPRR